jgi:hypothetical protein
MDPTDDELLADAIAFATQDLLAGLHPDDRRRFCAELLVLLMRYGGPELGTALWITGEPDVH